MRKITFFKTLFVTVLLIVTNINLKGQVSITAGALNYTQNFDGLATSGTSNTWTDNTTILGWYSYSATYIADAGSNTTGGIHSYGATSATERALGALSSSSASPIFGVRFTNNTGLTITSLDVSYRGEQWRQTTNSQSLVFEYCVGATSLTTGTWTAFTNLDFTSPNTGTASVLDGNTVGTDKTATITVTVTAGQEIWFRWKKTGSTSPGLAVDNLSVTATTSATTPAATPTFDPAAGTYTSAQSVTLNSTTTGAKIYYTTNGSDPSSASTLYTAPVNVSTTTTIKAIAYDQNNANPSSIASATYTINLNPTITVTETSIPAMTAEVGASDAETIHVSGINLTDNITLAITGTDAAQFNVDPTSITQTGGTASSTAVTVTYTPTAAGSHSALLEISSPGATTVTRDLTGTASLAKPVATTSDITYNSFKANWTAVSGATSYDLSVYTKAITGSVIASDLFISEYGEGSGGNKKYVEIYNGTGNDVDLANYTIKKAVNGAGWNATVYNFPTSTTLSNGSTFVVANNSTDVIGADAYDGFCNWNGDDAIGLFKNDVLIDVFGTPDSDPGNGWSIAGVTDASVDHILIRKSTITSPTTDWSSSAGTTTNDSQWEVSSVTYNATDQTTNLGTHTLDDQLMTTEAPISGSPFTGLTATSKTVTGLTANAEYFYRVVAKDGTNSSPVSDEMTVNTSPITSVDQTKILNISASNDKIRFSAGAGENIQVFNALGQRIVNKIASEGLNELAVSAKGVLVVKVGNKTAKIVL